MASAMIPDPSEMSQHISVARSSWRVVARVSTAAAGSISTPSGTRSVARAMSSRKFAYSFVVGLCAGALSVLLKMDVPISRAILEKAPSDPVVFGTFMTFFGIIAGFRSSHALERYTQAAGYLHRLSACWFDAASTLLAFSRTAAAATKEVQQFRETLLRLISKLSALCLEDLENRDVDGSSSRASRHSFEVLAFDDMDENVRDKAMNSKYKVEYVFQLIQMLAVDAIGTQVLFIAPDILARSFSELGHGMQTFHEARKISHVAFPIGYHLMNSVMALTSLIIIPVVSALNVPHSGVCAVAAFTFAFLMTYINGVANVLNNPFAKEANTLLTGTVQHELNAKLLQLIEMCNDPSPRVSTHVVGGAISLKMGNHLSLNALRSSHRAADSSPVVSSPQRCSDAGFRPSTVAHCTSSSSLGFASEHPGFPIEESQPSLGRAQLSSGSYGRETSLVRSPCGAGAEREQRGEERRQQGSASDGAADREDKALSAVPQGLTPECTPIGAAPRVSERSPFAL